MAPDLRALAQELTAAADGCGDLSGPDSFVQRKKILDLTKQINDEVQDPRERSLHYAEAMAEMAALRLLMHWKAFDLIPRPPDSIRYSELAERLGSDEPLLRRMLWMLVSTGKMNQVGDDRITHTKFSEIFARSDPQGRSFRLAYDNGNFAFSRWPSYFDKYGRKEPDEPTRSPLSYAYGREDKTFWDIVSGERLEDFNVTMQMLEHLLPVCGMFPFKWIAENAHLVADDAPLVVDVGGGQGQSLRQILKECPAIGAERMVLQDRPPVIEDAKNRDVPELRAVRKMPHDFFEEQPVKGALVYYVRRVLHNWSDKNNCMILGHLRDAMAPASRILITEQVMPNPPAPADAWLDLCMMGFGSKERTEQDWHELADAAGLEVVDIWKAETSETGVIELKKRQ
ncbi:O-methyltransferase family 2 [Neofusicoccum parvum]|uniref:O-methyltransferase family 2 n=1 Tax=Neofusicoccum parvum TaxID=310453 RepID=A0ACB5S8U2_9PEZI|nr:O-methyltransferase family 2 [Neofusicoccum parvum]